MIIRLFNQIKCRIYIESVGSLIIRLFNHSNLQDFFDSLVIVDFKLNFRSLIVSECEWALEDVAR